MEQKFTIDEIRNYLEGEILVIGLGSDTTDELIQNEALKTAIDNLEDKDNGIFATTMNDLKQQELDLMDDNV